MKLISVPTKIVDFHGLKIQVPDNKGDVFIIAEGNGEVYTVTKEPFYYQDGRSGWWSNGGDWTFVAKVDLEGMGWRETLVKVEQSK